MSSRTLPAFLADPRTRNFTFKVAAGALAGVIALACTPFVILRVGEFHAYTQHSPLRALSEFFGSTTLIGSAIAHAFGATCPKLLTRAVQKYIPAKIVGALPVLPTPASIGLRVALGAVLLYSLRQGMDPKVQTLANLEGKTALVTGGTSGIGFETAKALGRQGAHVILIVRNKAKGDHHASLIRSASGGKAKVTVLQADQEDLKAVASLQADIASAAPNGIDILLLNAGLAPNNPLVKSVSGYESTFTVMHLSHFLLTKMLWKSLNREARVVITSSVGHAGCSSMQELMGAITNVEDGSTVSKYVQKAYTRSKLANALFSRELGRMADMDNRRIRVTAHHPGAVATNIWTGALHETSLLARVFYFFANIFMRNNEEGAATLIDASAGVKALHGQVGAPNGSYYCSSRLVDSGLCFNPLLNSQEAATELWKKTEEFIAPFSPSGASWN
jgi:NAD(P)-dependent dehydrogenase (short-subunit alcohol dehydrogenase family)